MGKLLEYRNIIEDKVKGMGKEQFKIKGLIGLKVGFPVGMIDEKTPDDPARVQALQSAIKDILGVAV